MKLADIKPGMVIANINEDDVLVADGFSHNSYISVETIKVDGADCQFGTYVREDELDDFHVIPEPPATELKKKAGAK